MRSSTTGPSVAVTAPSKVAEAGNEPSGTASSKDAYQGPARYSAEMRQRQIELAAYFLAEARGFTGDGSLNDWLTAEAEFDAKAQSSST